MRNLILHFSLLPFLATSVYADTGKVNFNIHVVYKEQLTEACETRSCFARQAAKISNDKRSYVYIVDYDNVGVSLPEGTLGVEQSFGWGPLGFFQLAYDWSNNIYPEDPESLHDLYYNDQQCFAWESYTVAKKWVRRKFRGEKGRKKRARALRWYWKVDKKLFKRYASMPETKVI